MIDTALVLSTEDLEDLDFEEACDGVPFLDSCDLPVAWYGVFTCGHVRFWCDDHKNRALVLMVLDGKLLCNICQHVLGLPRGKCFVGVLSVEPKNRV